MKQRVGIIVLTFHVKSVREDKECESLGDSTSSYIHSVSYAIRSEPEGIDDVAL